MSSLNSEPKHIPQPDCSHALFHAGQWLDHKTDTVQTRVSVTICKPSVSEEEVSKADATLWDFIQASHDEEVEHIGVAGLAAMEEDDDQMTAFRKRIFESAVRNAYGHLNLDWNFDDIADYPHAFAWHEHTCDLEAKHKSTQTSTSRETPVTDPSALRVTAYRGPIPTHGQTFTSATSSQGTKKSRFSFAGLLGGKKKPKD